MNSGSSSSTTKVTSLLPTVKPLSKKIHMVKVGVDIGHVFQASGKIDGSEWIQKYAIEKSKRIIFFFSFFFI